MAKLAEKPALVRELSASPTLPSREDLSFIKSVGDWLKPKRGDRNDQRLEEMLELHREGKVSLQSFTAKSLRELDCQGRLLFKEPQVYQDNLDNLQLPFDPKKIGNPPIIFLQEAGRTIVMDGNHRTFKILDADFNPENAGLYVVVVHGLEAYQRLFKFSPTSALYNNPEIIPGCRCMPYRSRSER